MILRKGNLEDTSMSRVGRVDDDDTYNNIRPTATAPPPHVAPHKLEKYLSSICFTTIKTIIAP